MERALLALKDLPLSENTNNDDDYYYDNDDDDVTHFVPVRCFVATPFETIPCLYGHTVAGYLSEGKNSINCLFSTETSTTEKNIYMNRSK